MPPTEGGAGRHQPTGRLDATGHPRASGGKQRQGPRMRIVSRTADGRQLGQVRPQSRNRAPADFWKIYWGNSVRTALPLL